MGTEISCWVERKNDNQWRPVVDFPDGGEQPVFRQNYGIFGFLADVRNYSHSPVIAQPRGLPDDVSEEVREALAWDQPDGHDASWLTVAELVEYDYDQVIWDRRVSKEIRPGLWDGAALAEEGEGEHLPLREFLGQEFFQRLDELVKLGQPDQVRVVFWFL